jgi:hypothetical protein
MNTHWDPGCARDPNGRGARQPLPEPGQLFPSGIGRYSQPAGGRTAPADPQLCSPVPLGSHLAALTAAVAHPWQSPALGGAHLPLVLPLAAIGWSGLLRRLAGTGRVRSDAVSLLGLQYTSRSSAIVHQGSSPTLHHRSSPTLHQVFAPTLHHPSSPTLHHPRMHQLRLSSP